MRDKRWKRKKRRWLLRQAAFLLVILIAVGLLVRFGVYLFSQHRNKAAVEMTTEGRQDTAAANASGRIPEVPDTFSPHAVSTTQPDRLIVSTSIMVDGEELDSSENYNPWYHMDFASGVEYTDADGIVTFRGNSFRDDPTYGRADMQDYSIRQEWEIPTDSLGFNGKAWTGSGWTGQPLMMKWPAETKEHMNMYDWAKDNDDLVEVIYACLDGKVYFTDLKTGKPTRDVLILGFTFKGSGALDPRGYPILYLGSGYNSNQGRSRAFIVSLIDGSVLYTFGNEDPFADRSVSFFDSSALVDAESDTLIYPGENGVLYLLHLNTQYDEDEGTLTVDPDRTVKWKYRGKRSGDEFWLGMEDSAAVYGGYMFVADNGGNLMCLDLNTLELVWAQDTLDDTNSTPVLSVEDGHLYLYISTSFHRGWRGMDTAVIPIWKIDAETGEIVWQKDYECHTREGVSGGVESTIAVGRNDLSDYIYVTVSMTENTSKGVLACISKDNGQVAWEHEAAYAWSSPACVYNGDGSGAVLYCSSDGNMYLLDGQTGREYSSYDFGQTTIEASPAIYENYVVVGTRDCRICGFSLN
ncbi:MAG: PQQ-binding-like beta-propeller repeat protein [Eubacterium sp.]|nr:PQQ-binding-like beta-propeller repeat protein [Eubacterium sp.]